MAIRRNGLVAVWLGTALAWPILAPPGLAQDRLTAVILRGASGQPGPAGAAAQLQPGVRIESPAGTWTELAFSDGSSIVLESGADFTLQSFDRDRESGRLVIRSSAGRGRLRISTSDRVDVLLRTANAEVRVVGASAVVAAGQGGSATLLSGKRVLVVQGGREDVLRRPGFAVAFNEGVRRRSRPELAALMDPFAPVAMGGRQADAVQVAEARLTTLPVAVQRSTGQTANDGTAVLGRTTRTNDPMIVPDKPIIVTPKEPPGPTVVTRRSYASLEIALGGATGRSASGTRIASPAAGVATSQLNIDNRPFLPFNPVNGNPADPSFGDVRLSGYGTGRIRRFTPEASGSTAQRIDTGVATTNGVTQTIGSTLRNFTNQAIGPRGDTTFNDGVANVGVVTLVLLNQVVLTPRPDPATLFTNYDPAGPFTQVPIGSSGTVAFRLGTSPLVSVSGADAPNLAGTNVPVRDFTYNGSSLFETALRSGSAADGRVYALQGATGLIMVQSRSSSALPSPDLPTASNLALGCGPGAPCVVYGPSQPFQNGAPTRTAVAAGVHIIDKMTASSDRIQAERGIPPGERYFVIGGIPIAPTPQALPGITPGATTRYAISDGLDPARAGLPGGFVAGQAVEAQFAGPGSASQPIAFTGFNAFRPEETFASTAPRGDTHLLVTADPVTRAAGETPRNPAMRADLQITSDGRSTASASVGGIARLPIAIDPKGSLALSGQTVGSTQLATDRSALRIVSNLGSLGTDETGAGAHLLGESERAPGQAGYFAVGQADTRRSAPGTAAGAQPGALQGVAGPSAPFAYTRLATNVGAPNVGASSGQESGEINLEGHATGIVQAVRNGQAELYAVSTGQNGGVTITNASARSRAEFNAAFGLIPTAVGELSIDPAAALAPDVAGGARVVPFGNEQGAVPSTAAPSPTSFAAAGNGRAMASVDADLLKGIEGRNGTIAHPATGGGVDASLPPSSPHLAWGWFLGDVAAQANGASGTNHLHLGFWVAGRSVTLDTLRNLVGVSTYAGGMVGTAAQIGANGVTLRTATGQFAQEWDFGRRMGTLNATFDGTSWTSVRTGMADNSAAFTGSGAALGSAGRGELTLSVQGNFYHTPTAGGPVTSGNHPAAAGGLFGVRGPLGTYGANGVFVGTRR